MLTTIQETVEIGVDLPLPKTSKQAIRASKGLFKGKLPDAVELQRQLRDEWAGDTKKEPNT